MGKLVMRLEPRAGVAATTSRPQKEPPAPSSANTEEKTSVSPEFPTPRNTRNKENTKGIKSHEIPPASSRGCTYPRMAPCTASTTAPATATCQSSQPKNGAAA